LGGFKEEIIDENRRLRLLASLFSEDIWNSDRNFSNWFLAYF
jgi:hypothetical protein